MTVHYLDPSAWIKRHFQEQGSEIVNALFAGSLRAACCSLGLVKMVATIARKSHGASLDQSIVQMLLENVKADFAAFREIPADEERIAAAIELAMRHRLRAMDAIHLACALSLRPVDDVVMVSSDAELLAAAGRDGIITLNPAAGMQEVRTPV